MNGQVKKIETSRLTLLCCNKQILEALFEGDNSLATLLNINVPAQWTTFGEPAFKWTYEKLLINEEKNEWWCYLPILKKENRLVGSCGYKGEPVNGIVEIGYEVAEAYRSKGLATEMAQALIAFAMLHDEVHTVQAHTLAEENESGSVLKKAGMVMTGETEDPEDGKLWKWEIRK